MQKWEYETTWRWSDVEAWGLEGWELCAVARAKGETDAIFYLKRPVAEG